MSSSLRDRVQVPPHYHLDEKTIQTITGIARRSRPYEACGILAPPCMDPPTDLHSHYPTCDRVIELPNEALRALALGPDKAYAMETKAIVQAMMSWITDHPVTHTSMPFMTSEEDLRSFFSIWHTHPNGGAGPSHQDLLSVVPGFSYLVASLHAHAGGSSVNFTWF